MEQEEMFVTINHIEDFGGTISYRVGDILTLKKDHDNMYDDEAIIAYNKHKCKCGYVANSVCTVARGTLSAGRLYDRIQETCECKINFILDDAIIATVIPCIN